MRTTSFVRNRLRRLSRGWLFALLVCGVEVCARADTHRVPQNFRSIQSAIDVANPGDTILVEAGRYPERLRLKPGVSLKSTGAQSKDDVWARAEATIIDGNGSDGESAGVTMADLSSIEGFTITNVGTFNETLWQKHFDTHGEELGDDEGAVNAEGTIAAIQIRGVNCVVSNCIVKKNGDVGIAVIGDENRPTAPQVLNNRVMRNLGGGIGIANHSMAIVRGNHCSENLRAGIGCRSSDPIIAENVCTGNIRAGIGCREGSKATIRSNRCAQNQRAGIGIRMKGTAPIVEDNECRENEMAGIGCRDEASPILRHNQCIDNKLVAIGVSGAASAVIVHNHLSRVGGVPPIVAIRDGSSATVVDNEIQGGGVAAILVEGKAQMLRNRMTAGEKGKGTGVWVWEQSVVTISENEFSSYKMAVKSTKATVLISDNSITGFQGLAISVKESPKPSHIYGNAASAKDATSQLVEIDGRVGIVAENILKRASDD